MYLMVSSSVALLPRAATTKMLLPSSGLSIFHLLHLGDVGVVHREIYLLASLGLLEFDKP